MGSQACNMHKNSTLHLRIFSEKFLCFGLFVGQKSYENVTLGSEKF